jgi:hypothetical protein
MNVTKTSNISILPLQAVAAGSVVVSPVIQVEGKFGATVFVHFGRRSASAASGPVAIRLEGSSTASGNAYWGALSHYETAWDFAGTVVCGRADAGQKTIVIPPFLPNVSGLVYIDNAQIAASEWARIAVATAGKLTLEESLNNDQLGANVYGRAEAYLSQVDLTAMKRLRVVVDGSQFNQPFAIEVDAVTADSIG